MGKKFRGFVFFVRLETWRERSRDLLFQELFVDVFVCVSHIGLTTLLQVCIIYDILHHRYRSYSLCNIFLSQVMMTVFVTLYWLIHMNCWYGLLQETT